MKNTLKKLKARLLRPLKRYIDYRIDIVLDNYEQAQSDLESKVDNCVSLDWFSEEIEETNAFQMLRCEVEDLREEIKEITKQKEDLAYQLKGANFWLKENLK